MFYRIFLYVLISETILEASSDNGLLNTVTLENKNTSTKHPNANVVRKRLEPKNFVEGPTPTNFHHVSQHNDEEDERTSNLSFRREMNDRQAVILKKMLGRWVSMKKNKSKDQIPVLKARELYTQSGKELPQLAIQKTLEEGFVDKSPTNQVQLPIKGDNDILEPSNSVPHPWWMESPMEFPNTAIENVQLKTEPQESILLKKENEIHSIALKKFAANVEYNQWKTESAERNQLEPVLPIPEPWVKQYVIGGMNLPNSEGENQQFSTTEKELQKERDFIDPLTTQRTHALEPKEVNTQPTTATPDSAYQNWALILFDSKPNKLFEDEHYELENEHQRNKKQQEATSQTLLESAEVDNDRNKALRKKVETWYGNLQSRRKLANLRVSPDMDNVIRYRRDHQAAVAALAQRRQLFESQRSHAVDYRRLSRWRRQLLNEYSMPEAVDYRRLLSLWQKELRRQLQIKWNRRPLVEISPGAFKTDIYVNPPDDLSNHMQKLLALKKRQEERNRDLNAGREESA